MQTDDEVQSSWSVLQTEVSQLSSRSNGSKVQTQTQLLDWLRRIRRAGLATVEGHEAGIARMTEPVLQTAVEDARVLGWELLFYTDLPPVSLFPAHELCLCVAHPLLSADRPI
jgi:hypothetical protein